MVKKHFCLFLFVIAAAQWGTGSAVRIVKPGATDIIDDETSSYLASPGGSSRRLQAVNVPVPSNPDEHLVTSLPLLQDGEFTTKHWAGLLPASENAGDKYLFYWLFAPEIPDDNDGIKEEDLPLILWLNGGPGCSSMDGLFLENGPLRLEAQTDGTWKMTAAEYSWHKIPAYVLYLDQPVGTGLSFTTSRKYPKNDQEVNIDFYHWLVQFLQLHSDKFLTPDKKSTSRPFYFSGESHAGHYIPSMIAYIMDQNKKSPEINISVSGAAIGNGWMDPFHQYAVAEAAYGHGLVGRAQKAALDVEERKCQDQLNSGHLYSQTCFRLLDKVVDEAQGKRRNYKVSQYDARKWEMKHQSRDFPPGHKDLEAYLGEGRVTTGKPKMPSGTRIRVLEAVHASDSLKAGQIYQECTDPPYIALQHQDGLGVVDEVVRVLEDESSIRLLFFNGMQDLICNHVGNEIFLEKMPWKRQNDWINSPRASWTAASETSPERISGYAKELDNLVFLKVLDSGHMVPMDLPHVAIDMMRVLVSGQSFMASEQQIDRAKEDTSCPICPAPASCETTECPEVVKCDKSKEETKAEEDAQVAKFVIAHAWLGAFFGVAVFLMIMLFRRRTNNSLRATVIPHQYDMEMREGKYRDSLTDEYDHGHKVNDDPSSKMLA